MITVTREKPTYDSGIEYNGTRLLLLPASKTLCEMLTESREKRGSDMLEQSYAMAAELLNTNDRGITVDRDEVNGLDIITIKNLIHGYAEFIGGVKNDPN